MRFSRFGYLLAVLLTSIVMGCGGGGGGSTPALPSFTVSTNAGAGGSITPSSATVRQGNTTSFTVNAEVGYVIDSVSGCGGALSDDTYTTGPINADCTVSATFALVTLDPPGDLVAQAGNARVLLNWSPVSEATGYRVYWSTTPDIHPYTAASYDGFADVSETHNSVSPLQNGVAHYFVVTATMGAAESAASAEVTATPRANALTDTGVTRCGDYAYPPGGSDNHDNDLDCEAAGATATVAGTDPNGDVVPAGQDAHFGRDVLAAAGLLLKAGGGEAGFDFTRVCNSGELAGEDSCPADPVRGLGQNEWGCTLDNHTGLMWELKVGPDATHPRDVNHTYLWYNPDPATNGGNPGTEDLPPGTPARLCADTLGGEPCNTHAFVQYINATGGICGASDWRMPTRIEYMSIVNYGRANPSYDRGFFSDITSVTFAFWTSSAYAKDDEYAWMYFGAFVTNLKRGGNHVRLVRVAD